jgi:hypothetical protein
MAMLSRTLFLAGIVLGVSIPLTGCGLMAPVVSPVSQSSTSNVDQGKAEGYIRFVNATSEHAIFIDGTSIGSGEAYDSGGTSTQGVLAVSPGTHLVEVMKGSQVLYQRKVFLGTGITRSITIP